MVDVDDLIECNCGTILSNSILKKDENSRSPNDNLGRWEYNYIGVCPVCKEEISEWW